MKSLIFANELHDIHPQGDSTLYMLRAMLEKGYECYWSVEEKLVWENDQVFVESSIVESCDYRNLPKLGKSTKMNIKDFDLCFIRKDPPFNERYIRLCWLLTAFEKDVHMVNKPSLLARYHEKIVPLFARVDGDLLEEDFIPTCLPARGEDAVDFVKSQNSQHIVVKPWLGYAGHDVMMIDKEEFLQNPYAFIPRDRYFIIQPFDEKVYEHGDLRVFYIGGEYKGHFARIPREGSFVSNLGQGGSAKARNLTPGEEQVIARLGKWLSKVGIDFAGADLISGKLNEVNITSPTGISQYEELTQIDLSKALIDSLS